MWNTPPATTPESAASCPNRRHCDIRPRSSSNPRPSSSCSRQSPGRPRPRPASFATTPCNNAPTPRGATAANSNGCLIDRRKTACSPQRPACRRPNDPGPNTWPRWRHQRQCRQTTRSPTPLATARRSVAGRAARPIETSVSGGSDQVIVSDGLPQFPERNPAAHSGPDQGDQPPGAEVIAAPVGVMQNAPGQVEVPPELERPGSRRIPSPNGEARRANRNWLRSARTSRESARRRRSSSQSGRSTRSPTNIKATTGDFPHECGIGAEAFVPRRWPEPTYTWKAAATCHKPLYFEQVAPERYGHTWGPVLEPIIEGAHFFVTIPLCPTKWAWNCPTSASIRWAITARAIAHLFMLDPLPLSVRGALFEGAAVTGAVLLVP